MCIYMHRVSGLLIELILAIIYSISLSVQSDIICSYTYRRGYHGSDLDFEQVL